MPRLTWKPTNAGRPRRLPPREVLLGLMLAEDLTMKEIGARYGVSRQAVHHAIGKSIRGGARRPRQRAAVEAVRDQLTTALQSGATGAEAAQLFGVSQAVVQHVFKIKELRPPLVTQHGTFQRYQRGGCRCERCTAVAREFNRVRNQRARERRKKQ